MLNVNEMEKQIASNIRELSDEIVKLNKELETCKRVYAALTKPEYRMDRRAGKKPELLRVFLRKVGSATRAEIAEAIGLQYTSQQLHTLLCTLNRRGKIKLINPEASPTEKRWALPSQQEETKDPCKNTM